MREERLDICWFVVFVKKPIGNDYLVIGGNAYKVLVIRAVKQYVQA